MTQEPNSQPFGGWMVWILFLALSFSPACSSLEYDLSGVPIPISAKPVSGKPSAVAPLTIQAKSILWAHGLFGQSNPDVTALITEAAKGYDRIADFRVVVSTGFHEWLVTHLTATLVRMKTVYITGQLVKD